MRRRYPAKTERRIVAAFAKTGAASVGGTEAAPVEKIATEDRMHLRGKRVDGILGYSETVSWFTKFDPKPSELRGLSGEELAILFPQGLIAGLSAAGRALLERKRRLSIFRVVRGGKP